MLKHFTMRRSALATRQLWPCLTHCFKYTTRGKPELLGREGEGQDEGSKEG